LSLLATARLEMVAAVAWFVQVLLAYKDGSSPHKSPTIRGEIGGGWNKHFWEKLGVGALPCRRFLESETGVAAVMGLLFHALRHSFATRGARVSAEQRIFSQEHSQRNSFHY